MPVPPEPVLRGALRWLERIPESGVDRTRSLLLTNPQLADLTPTQYATAFEWLRRSGLLHETTSSQTAAERVYARAVMQAGWFYYTDALVRGPEEMPEDALYAAEAVGIGPDDAYQHLVTLWGKVDTEERERVGAAGEAALVSLLAASISATVEHVAAVSDGYGYDIAVTSGTVTIAHLEVKSTIRRGRTRAFLSRNEYEVMRRDSHWRMVIVHLNAELGITALSSVSTGWLLASAPRDSGHEARWESCRFEVPAEATEPGIPALNPVLKPAAPALLGLPR